MITYWATDSGTRLFGRYLQTRGTAVAPHFDVRCYDDLGSDVTLQPGPQIYSGLDQLTPGEWEALGLVLDAHATLAPLATRLNTPGLTRTRLTLLRELSAAGVNRFRVFSARDAARVARFPVFVRGVEDHDGPLTNLLPSRWALLKALACLAARGWSRDELLIAEFCDTRERDGRFRKYSAFKVGPRIVACHVMLYKHWMVKREQSELTERALRADDAYVHDNPHEALLRPIFEQAGVGYGRIDYSLLDGQIQVWEINLAPTIGRGTLLRKRAHLRLSEPLQQLRIHTRELFHSRLRDAFLALDDASAQGWPAAEARVTIPADVRDRIARERATVAARRESRAVRRARIEAHRLRPWLERIYTDATLFPTDW